MPVHILIVEDEPSIRDNIIYSLESEGFVARPCGTGAEAIASAHVEPAVALVILDVGLPDMTGFDVCRELRREREVPVIFLTARSAEIDRVVGLEIGGDDYVTKPFSPRELTARVRAVLRRTQPTTTAPHENTTQAFHVDEARFQIRYLDRLLVLSKTEFRVLTLLIRQPGRVFTRAQLMDHAWEEPDASLERTVDSHVKSIRAKLREIDNTRDPIVTHRGIGYALSESL